MPGIRRINIVFYLATLKPSQFSLKGENQYPGNLEAPRRFNAVQQAHHVKKARAVFLKHLGSTYLTPSTTSRPTQKIGKIFLPKIFLPSLLPPPQAPTIAQTDTSKCPARTPSRKIGCARSLRPPKLPCPQLNGATPRPFPCSYIPSPKNNAPSPHPHPTCSCFCRFRALRRPSLRLWPLRFIVPLWLKIPASASFQSALQISGHSLAKKQRPISTPASHLILLPCIPCVP